MNRCWTNFLYVRSFIIQLEIQFCKLYIKMILEIIWFCIFVAGIYILFSVGTGNNNSGKPKPPLPPGPWGLPIFGHMFFMGSKSHLVINKWSKKYGKVMGLHFGPAFKTTIIISDPNLIKEAFNDNNLNGRPDIISFNATSGGKHGIIFADGKTWADQRRFAAKHLREFGLGKNTMELLIQDELNELLETFQSNLGQPIEIRRKFSLAVLNAIWVVITGKRYNHDDPKLTAILNIFASVYGALGANPLLLFFPSLAEIIPKLTGFDKFLSAIHELQSFFKESIDEHKKTLQEDNPRDLVDAYLVEIGKTTDKGSSFYQEAGEKSLLAVIGDFFEAASETTSLTLSWAMIYLINYPEVQKMLSEEIDRITKKSRSLTLADRPRMPYLESFIMEILRITSIAPNGLIHQALVDVEFHGFLIPKHASIMPNIYGIHHDKEIWGDPENFRPERFLNEQGECIKKHDALQAFSVGKRACLGESLARDTLFLFLTGIIQRFEVQSDPSKPVIDLDPKPGLMLAPKKFKVVLLERK